MCSDCDEAQPCCQYCGDTCFGSCEDPDSRSTCWLGKNSNDDVDSGDFDDNLDRCIEEECRCRCHEFIFKDQGIGPYAFLVDDDGNEFERHGIFPLLSLLLELRECIYHYASLQDGNARRSRNHRGTIHTALLKTCRQVYHEAGHLPLASNHLCFNNPVHILDFLGFYTTPGMRMQLSSMVIEMHPMASHDSSVSLSRFQI